MTRAIRESTFHAVDLFAGAGGLSLGFSTAGFTVTGYEGCHSACRIHQNNITTGSCNHQLLTMKTTLPHRPDIVLGGPPCQPFSRSGKQAGNEDPRNGVAIFLYLARQMDPDFVLMENVPNLKHHGLQRIVDELEQMGYRCYTSILNSVDYGVAQRRRRLFLAATKYSRYPFEWPAPLGTETTVKDVIGDTAFAENDNPSLSVSDHTMKRIRKYEETSGCINSRDLLPNRPARTFTCRNLAGKTNDMIRLLLQDGTRRELTVAEAAAIHGFPEHWFRGMARGKAMKMIGNAVPPALSEAIANAVVRHLKKNRNIE